MIFFFSKGSFGRSFGNNIIITIRGKEEDPQGLKTDDVEETGGQCFLRVHSSNMSDTILPFSQVSYQL